jgi:phosphoribosylformylglycinamidine cyclo-ligase
VRSCLAALRETGGIKAFAHITGGGFHDNIPRILPHELNVRLDLAKVPVLPVFRWLAATGGIGEQEMLRTFNCGIGLIVIAASEDADSVLASFALAGEIAVRLGHVAPDCGESADYDGRLDLAW